jgi:hypothetical protein
VRPDGDPDRDDYGLPHVDVVVPDDARELDRDLIAYRRELRQARRRAALRRMLGPFGRYGAAVPIISAALLIAVISGVLITVLGPREASQGLDATPSATHQASPQPGQTNAPLPAGTVSVEGTSQPIQRLTTGIVILIPEPCADCAPSVQSLLRQVQQTSDGLKAYLVGSQPWTAEARKQFVTSASAPSWISFVQDSRDTLANAYRASGLTVLLVHSDGIVGDILRDQQSSGRSLTSAQLLAMSKPGHIAGSPVP